MDRKLNSLFVVLVFFVCFFPSVVFGYVQYVPFSGSLGADYANKEVMVQIHFAHDQYNVNRPFFIYTNADGFGFATGITGSSQDYYHYLKVYTDGSGDFSGACLDQYAVAACAYTGNYYLSTVAPGEDPAEPTNNVPLASLIYGALAAICFSLGASMRWF